MLTFFVIVSTVTGNDNAGWLYSVHDGHGFVKNFPSAGIDGDVTWQLVANAGRPVGRASGGVIGDYYYLFGGIGQPVAQVFNWETEHWQLSTEPPLGNCNWAGVSTGAAIYLIGGYADYTIRKEVQRFIPFEHEAVGSWDSVADYPFAAAGIAAAWDGGDKIYAAGGSNLSQVFASANVYSIASDAWTEVAALPIAMTYAGGAFLQGKFHVIGGVQDPSTAHYIYDPASDQWSEAAPLPIGNPFALFCLTADDQYIYSVGGGGGYADWPAIDAVQIYDPATAGWMQETPVTMAFGLNAAAVIPGGSVVTVGGFDGVKFYPFTQRGDGFPGSGSGLEKASPQMGSVALNVHPNPANAGFQISFDLSEDTFVQLNLFDIMGREVMALKNKYCQEGRYQMDVGAADLPSGIYLLRLNYPASSIEKKIVLIK
ncbi:MAG: T9SS type A sorting domain-containing protein [bacterium]